MTAFSTQISVIYCDAPVSRHESHTMTDTCNASFETEGNREAVRKQAKAVGWKSRRATRGTLGPAYTMDMCPKHARPS